MPNPHTSRMLKELFGDDPCKSDSCEFSDSGSDEPSEDKLPKTILRAVGVLQELGSADESATCSDEVPKAVVSARLSKTSSKRKIGGISSTPKRVRHQMPPSICDYDSSGDESEVGSCEKKLLCDKSESKSPEHRPALSIPKRPVQISVQSVEDDDDTSDEESDVSVKNKLSSSVEDDTSEDESDVSAKNKLSSSVEGGTGEDESGGSIESKFDEASPEPEPEPEPEPKSRQVREKPSVGSIETVKLWFREHAKKRCTSAINTLIAVFSYKIPKTRPVEKTDFWGFCAKDTSVVTNAIRHITTTRSFPQSTHQLVELTLFVIEQFTRESVGSREASLVELLNVLLVKTASSIVRTGQLEKTIVAIVTKLCVSIYTNVRVELSSPGPEIDASVICRLLVLAKLYSDTGFPTKMMGRRNNVRMTAYFSYICCLALHDPAFAKVP